MQSLRTLGWLACVVYSTIPLFWLMVHPRAHVWRKREGSPFRVLVPAWIVMWFGMGALTEPWHKVTLYSTAWSWLGAALLFAVGIVIYWRAGAHFSWAQLGGLPEVRPRRSGDDHPQDRLVTTGIRAQVRHPVYLAHLCEMLAWSVGTGLVVCWALTAFAIATGTVMIRMEDAELEERFGEDFRRYKKAVPAVLPDPSRVEHPLLSSDGARIRYEVKDKGSWQIAIADLECLGEYTNENGPYLDDYFLVFALKSGCWYVASFYSDGRDDVIKAIGKALGCELKLGLAHSTTYASRIIWPKELEGRPVLVEKVLNPDLKRFLNSRQL